MSCRFENGSFVDCGLHDNSPDKGLLSQSIDTKSQTTKEADPPEKASGLFGKLFGKKDGGSALGNTFRDKEKRENTVRDILDLGSLFGLTKSSTGQSREDFERQRQLELQQMRAMEARNRQARILGMPVWAFVLLLGFIILLTIVFVSKLKRN